MLHYPSVSCMVTMLHREAGRLDALGCFRFGLVHTSLTRCFVGLSSGFSKRLFA